MAAAARLLNITPAAVAQQIRTLEREIGAPLIARAGRTVSVTEDGARILQRARDLLRDVADLRSVANENGSRRRAAAGRRARPRWPACCPTFSRAWSRRFPQINVFIKPGYSADLYRAVEKRRAGCGDGAAGAVHAAQDLRLAAAARGAAGRAGAAEHGRARSARTARDAAADPLRPQPMGRAPGRRVPAAWPASRRASASSSMR